MSRGTTPNLLLGVFDDGDNPGAGSKLVDSNGLNGNMIKLDTAVGTGHNADGSHKNDVIHKANLSTDVADGATIERDATVGLRVKDAGVTTSKIADANVTMAKIADANVTTAKIADANVTTAKIADSNVTTAKILDAAVTAAKLASQSVTPAKLQYQEVILQVNQSGTGAPVSSTITDNYYGSPITYTWARSGTGIYTLTSSAAIFAAGKTVVIPPPCWHVSYGLVHVVVVRTSTTVLTVYSYRGDTNVLADTAMTDLFLLIRIYP